jgi:drug/metabolite transporter (DMT)-like permease
MAEAKQFNQCLLLILIGLMILTGSINTIFNKILQKLYGKGIIFEQHHWIITFGMFLGELVSIFFYIYVVIKRNKKKGEKLVGDKPDEEAGETVPPEEENEGENKPPIPTNFFFCITALCDLTATTINTFGLTYLTTSMFQMMRGLELFFVCLWSKIFLKNPIYRHQILGVSTLIFGLSLVGLNSILNDKDSEVAKNPVVGIILLSTSQLFTSTEYIIQEKFIKHYDVHPFQLVGFEGLWGSLMYSILLVIFQFVSCDDWSDTLRKGICFTNDKEESYIEDTRFAFEQMWDNKSLLIVYIFYVVSIALYNIVGINLTKLVSSTARAVVDTVRTVFIWGFFLFFTPVEGTKEEFHILQFIGFIFLVCGTLVYNEIVTLPFWNLDYYTRVNIAKRKKEEKGGENEEERDKLYNSIKQSIDSNSNENPDKNNE